MNKILPLCLTLITAACSMDKSASMLQDTTDSKYHVGDIYAFQSRPTEPNARLTVVKVEYQKKIGTVIHIRVDSVKVKTSQNPVRYSTVITHMPFSKPALDSSGLRKLGEAKTIPDYQEGYNEWRASFDKGNAGVFTISVGKSVEYMEKTAIGGHTVDE